MTWTLSTASPALAWPGLVRRADPGGTDRLVRRDDLVPVPDVASVAGLNAMIDRWDAGTRSAAAGSPTPTPTTAPGSLRSLPAPMPYARYRVGLVPPAPDMSANHAPGRHRHAASWMTVPGDVPGRIPSACPAVGAASIARPETPKMLELTLESLT